MAENAQPKTLNITVPLTPAYQSKYVNVRATWIELSLLLTDGEHIITTPLTDVGDLPLFFKDPALQAGLTVWYSYDAAANTLFLCANNYISEHSIYLTTQPKGIAQFCRQYNNPGNNNPAENNPNWNYCTPLTPGLKEAFARTLQAANNLIREKALAEGISVSLHAPPPELDAALYEKLCAVYHNNEFLELYDPEKEYTTEHSLVHFFSYLGGTGSLANNQTAFANAIDTTHDPKHDGQTSWIGLWAASFGQANGCASLGYFSTDNPFTCGNTLVGGHCILGINPAKPPKGSNSVFIIPICNSHNGKKATPGYMLPVLISNYVWLKNFGN